MGLVLGAGPSRYCRLGERLRIAGPPARRSDPLDRRGNRGLPWHDWRRHGTHVTRCGRDRSFYCGVRFERVGYPERTMAGEWRGRGDALARRNPARAGQQPPARLSSRGDVAQRTEYRTPEWNQFTRHWRGPPHLPPNRHVHRPRYQSRPAASSCPARRSPRTGQHHSDRIVSNGCSGRHGLLPYATGVGAGRPRVNGLCDRNRHLLLQASANTKRGKRHFYRSGQEAKASSVSRMSTVATRPPLL